MGRGRYENDNREIIDNTEVIIANPAVTADIKTNAGNVCEYWDASCHVQQGMDSIVENVVQAGENITSWGDSTTKWIQGGFVEAGENVQVAYVENIETPIVEAIQGGQDFIDETIQGGQDFIDETIQGGQDFIDETIQGGQDLKLFKAVLMNNIKMLKMLIMQL